MLVHWLSVRPSGLDSVEVLEHRRSKLIEGPWPAVTSGFLPGETPELQLGTSML